MGLTPEGYEPGKLLSHILMALRKGLRLSRSLPSTENRYEETISGFSSWLEYASTSSQKASGLLFSSSFSPLFVLDLEFLCVCLFEKNIVIAINAVDQFEDFVAHYSWLPRQFPPGVKVILSCSPGRKAVTIFEGRKWTEVIRVKPLSQPEKLRILSEHLLLYRKTCANASPHSNL